MQEWTRHRKNVLILSSSGKPIWTRHGDDTEIISLMGIIQAIISVHIDSDDPISTIYAREYTLVFELFGPIYLVAISCTGETEDAVISNDYSSGIN
jgi:vacuolar fusion protein MON1